ncbi:MAG TPA: SDR family NAD(P)-dependent oxidoreductase [Solirubrobacterales bacterium]
MGTTVLITGASSGIGEATAKRLAREPGARLILVARREDRLRALADALPCPATYVAADLTDDDAPEIVRAHVAEHYDRLTLLVNNAGGAWRGTFGEGGYANVQLHMELNFDAVLRLTEALLPALRAAAPSSIVNIASTAGRISRARTGAYSASKFALIGWSDSLYAEEKPHGVHVGLVLPGFIKTEGFPATELREKALTRWIVSEPEKVAEAIVETGLAARPSATSRGRMRLPRSFASSRPAWCAVFSPAEPPRLSPPARPLRAGRRLSEPTGSPEARRGDLAVVEVEVVDNVVGGIAAASQLQLGGHDPLLDALLQRLAELPQVGLDNPQVLDPLRQLDLIAGRGRDHRYLAGRLAERVRCADESSPGDLSSVGRPAAQAGEDVAVGLGVLFADRFDLSLVSLAGQRILRSGNAREGKRCDAGCDDCPNSRSHGSRTSVRHA